MRVHIVDRLPTAARRLEPLPAKPPTPLPPLRLNRPKCVTDVTTVKAGKDREGADREAVVPRHLISATRFAMVRSHPVAAPSRAMAEVDGHPWGRPSSQMQWWGVSDLNQRPEAFENKNDFRSMRAGGKLSTPLLDHATGVENRTRAELLGRGRGVLAGFLHTNPRLTLRRTERGGGPGRGGHYPESMATGTSRAARSTRTVIDRLPEAGPKSSSVAA
jgi:hypothetical protein